MTDNDAHVSYVADDEGDTATPGEEEEEEEEEEDGIKGME